jgi:hypothetical protein
MTTKEKAFNIMETMEGDAAIDQAIYRLSLLRKTEIGQQQITDGENNMECSIAIRPPRNP